MKVSCPFSATLPLSHFQVFAETRQSDFHFHFQNIHPWFDHFSIWKQIFEFYNNLYNFSIWICKNFIVNILSNSSTILKILNIRERFCSSCSVIHQQPSNPQSTVEVVWRTPSMDSILNRVKSIYHFRCKRCGWNRCWVISSFYSAGYIFFNTDI